jgi:hypothetical protein
MWKKGKLSKLKLQQSGKRKQVRKEKHLKFDINIKTFLRAKKINKDGNVIRDIKCM